MNVEDIRQTCNQLAGGCGISLAKEDEPKMRTPKVYMDFTIFGNHFVPQEVTKRLGIIPTKFDEYHRGYDPETQTFVYESYWRLEERQHTWMVEDCLKQLTAKLIPCKDQIIEVERCFDAYVRLNIAITLNRTNGPGMFLDSETLQFLANINASVDVDIQ